MKIKLACVILFLLSSLTYAQKGWFSQQVPANIYQMNDIFALNDNIAFAVGDSGKIIKTTDGGVIWSLISQKDSPYNIINSVFFVDTLFGYAVGKDIIKTTDGGKNWLKQTSDAYFVFTSICFINRDTGWISGGGYGAVYKTVNGGENWIKQQTGANYQWMTSVWFSDSNNGFATGINAGWGIVNAEYGAFVSTTNGGDTWSFKKDHDLYSVSFENPYFGWMMGRFSGDKSLFYFTEDGGKNWESKFVDYYINDISFKNINDGWGIGKNFIIHTTDCGESWNLQLNITNDSSSTSFNTIHSRYNSTSWVCGTKTFWRTGKTVGVIYKYIDSIASGVSNFGNDLPNTFSLSQNYPNPFNPSTKIKYSIPTSPQPSPYKGEGARVRLKVYDILGNEVATLVNEEQPAGEYEVEFKGTDISSGIYFYQLKVGNFIETKKMIFLK